MSERDIVSSPTPKIEPPQQTGAGKWRFFKIGAANPNEYVPAAGIYPYLPDTMTFRHLANAARQKGDYVEEITAEEIPSGEERHGPTPVGNGFMARKPGEILFVGPKTGTAGGNFTSFQPEVVSSNPWVRPLTPEELKNAT